MDLQISTDTRLAYRAASETTSQIQSLAFTFRSGERIRLRFVDSSGTPVLFTAGTQVIFICKRQNRFLDAIRAFSNDFTAPADPATGWYEATVPFTNELIGTDLNGADPDESGQLSASGDYMSAVIWLEPGELQQGTPAIPTKIYNALYESGESLPLGVGLSASFPVFFSSITGLVGGTAADLDSIPTADGAFPLLGIAQFVDSTRGLVSYQLRPVESVTPPSSVEPIDYDVETNVVSWWEV